ncbi:MAG: hypothetical protein Q9185_004653 [Variospora sp. 1 TL-2023]
MAMGSQFSLSLELTKLVPFGSLFNTAGHGLVRLLREIQASGSDFITEQDLAEVFGRNRLEPRFASTFRTAVKNSVIHQISHIAELVLEGGAGPTVKRSFSEEGYFAMVVQLSLLIYTHELSSLAGAMAISFERRNKDSAEYVAPPRYDALKGTLRAIREQTCGFMWELTISAVEKKVYPSIAWTDGSLYQVRTIPQVILQALLDAFTAIQHLPEHTRLQISSANGLPTIVVWAHHILGLSVKVHINGESHVFGNELVTVYVDGDYGGSPKVALLNETDDPFFQLIKKREDPVLEPVRRHPIRDYGTRLYRYRDEDRETERGLVHLIVATCMAFASFPDEANNFLSVQRVLSVSKLLFSSNEDVIDGIDPCSTFLCVEKRPETGWLSAEFQDHDDDLWHLFRGYAKLAVELMHIIFVLCRAQGFEDDISLYIDVLPESQYIRTSANHNLHRILIEVPSPELAFSSLSSLLLGPAPRPGLEEISVVSAWGWSLCLSSVSCQDPSDCTTGFAFVRGVPARNGERKHYIIDGAWSLMKEALSHDTAKYSRFQISHGPGDQCILSSWTRLKDRRYFIGVKDDAFEVANVLSYDDPAVDAKDRGVAGDGSSVTCGFRSMQHVSWAAHHTPPCQHPASPGQSSLVLPENVFVFRGVGRPRLDTFQPGAVLAGLVAGDSSARWILTAMMVHNWRASLSKWGAAPRAELVVCLRSRGCCFECAVRYAQSCNRGAPVGLVL